MKQRTCKFCGLEKNSRPHTDCVKNRYLTKMYGLSLKDYNKMLDEQSALCAICSVKSKLVVDHCHTTGDVRGLLCHRCNSLLGALDDKFFLSKATVYLSSRQGS